MLLKKRRPKQQRLPEPVEQRPIFRDPRNFSLVVEKYQTIVFRYVFNMVHDYHQAEDLTQEIFAKVYRFLPSYNAKYPFSAWLLRIAHNHAVDYTRLRRLQTVPYEAVANEDSIAEDHSVFVAPESVGPDEVSQRKFIQDAIYALPVDNRAVIVLRYLEGVKLEEIAYILGIPLGTVKSRINRARLVLQRALAQAFKDRSRR
ncbi:MAG: sigma-70 family RNA polymerase sigma factor [Candidatus Wallbacteria bacterium]|nr:sigma-70 family RNA polymerase sigma factor [Candidatus Wallbacteria bacterium]